MQIVTGYIPFHVLRDVAVVAAVLRGERPPMDADVWNSDKFEELKDIVRLCWQTDPKNRPSMAAVLQLLPAPRSALLRPFMETLLSECPRYGLKSKGTVIMILVWSS